MTRTRFRYDFVRGLGSALLELQACEDPALFSDIVLYGCLHDTTYDMQSEGDRGWYLYEAAKLAGMEVEVEEAVCRKLSRVNDIWVFDQSVSILYHMAKDKRETAREVLYQLYDRMLDELQRRRVLDTAGNRRDMFEWLCVWLTSLDGWVAFKMIVSDVSERLLPKDADFFFLEWFYDNAKGKFSAKRIEKYLSKKAAKSPPLRVYYEKAQAWDYHKFENPPTPTLDGVLSQAEMGRFRRRWLAMRFARKASPAELEKLAQAAMEATDADMQIELLWPFRSFRSFPDVVRYDFPEDFLTKLGQSDNPQLRETAYEIIGQNPSAKTRELALSLLDSGDTFNGVSLLVKKLMPGDEVLLYDLLKTIPVRIGVHENDWHGIYSEVLAGMKTLRGKPKTEILEYMYRHTRCGACREYIVRLMHKKGVLSEAIRNECFYDANDDIRELV
jgi:hypothetical protein